MLKHRLNQSGDTIVEVLIAVVIIGIMLSGAYLVTSKNLTSERQAQERDQGVQLLQTELETISSGAVTPPATPFCVMIDSSGTASIQPASLTPCSQNADASTYSGGQPDFQVKITPIVPGVGINPYYNAVASWTELGSAGVNQQETVTINYRTN